MWRAVWRAAAWAAVGLGVSLAAAAAQPPAWTDEPPQLSRWIEAGWTAENAGRYLVAADHYCQAARFGSVEAQFQLGRLYRTVRPDPDGQAQAQALLTLAARQGHEAARLTLLAARDGAISPDRLPECLVDGRAPQFELAAVPANEPVPAEVVQRFVEALPPDKRRHAELIQRLAPRFAVDHRLALAIARAESNFEPRAVSPRNAQGLMQLIPDTAERFGVRNPFDPEQNVRGGLSYLRWLLQRFDGDVALVCAAYNAGEGVVERYGGVPPYPETRSYVDRILHFYRAPRHAPPPVQ